MLQPTPGMKHFFIAGNWKSFKGQNDARTWFAEFISLWKTGTHQWSSVTAVLCPPYTLLPFARDALSETTIPLQLGAQDVSPLGEGAYTGEINAGQVSEFASWTIIGHSERRKNLGETDPLLIQKVSQAKAAGLHIMYCVQDESVFVPDGVDVIAYEPPWAISAVSGGIAQNPESANRVCEKIVAKHPGIPVIYGGSTTPDNVLSFVRQPAISGVLPGGASMDPTKFFRMIELLATVS